jgi:mRNA interferase RelE/StbE
MNKEQKFKVKFDSAVVKEYEKLDNSIIQMVDKVIDELEKRADEVGKPLGNTKNAKLAGCREIKLRDIGVRIIYKITNEFIQVLKIVYVLAIAQRADEYVFKVAHQRFKRYKNPDKNKKE